MYGVTHAYLKVAALGAALSAVNVESFPTLHLARLLACAKDPANTFVNAWEAAGWHSNPSEVGEELAAKMTAIEQADFWPTGDAPTAVLQRKGTRLAALIKEVNEEAGKQPHDVSWAGSPQVIEQLIASI